VGEVNFGGPRQNELAKSPLGIYGSEQMLLEEDGAGNRLASPVELCPTVTPGTLQLPAAHGFTTLDAAEILKGKAPIDAIRVRVAGVARYDAAGEARVRRVAEEIVARTGLRVEIVAGSSPRQVTIDLPGHAPVEPLGKARTWWLSLGVTTVIDEVFSLFASIFITAFIIVGLVFVYNRSRIYLWQRRQEVAVLQTEGWTNSAVTRLFTLEIALLWMAAGAVTLVLGLSAGSLLEVPWTDISMRWAAVLLTGGLLFVGSVYHGLGKTKILPGGVKVSRKKWNRPQGKSNSPGGIKALLRSDLSYYGSRLLPMAVQLIFGGSLSLFAWLAVSAAGMQLTPTRLGEFIYARAGLWLGLIGLATLLCSC
jgi:putative ABC transport system permease protein